MMQLLKQFAFGSNTFNKTNTEVADNTKTGTANEVRAGLGIGFACDMIV
jgi:hypothetical protein